MIVVSDTSPLTGLPSVGAADILTKLFSEVAIPEAVRDELLRSHSPLPPWLRVETVKNLAQARQYARIVDAGEAEAIELAKELHADRLLALINNPRERGGWSFAIQFSNKRFHRCGGKLSHRLFYN